MTSVLLSERHDHAVLLTLNRPDVRNAVNLELATELGRAIEAAEKDPDVWAVVLTGSGQTAFCAGADLKAIARGEAIRPSETRRAAWGFAGFVTHPMSKPTIAAVNGYATGGGMEIVLACDLAVSSETATFALPEVSRGIIAAWGGALRLPAQIPQKLAMELILTGEQITAARAAELGLVNRVVPGDQLVEAALELAETICRNAPLAVRASKRVALGLAPGGLPLSEQHQWALSRVESEAVLRSADASEGIAAFAERRTPEWTGA